MLLLLFGLPQPFGCAGIDHIVISQDRFASLRVRRAEYGRPGILAEEFTGRFTAVHSRASAHDKLAGSPDRSQKRRRQSLNDAFLMLCQPLAAIFRLPRQAGQVPA